MSRLISLLVSCLLIFSPFATAQTTNPAYLGKLPSPQRIAAELKGSDPMDTAARHMGAFWRLRQIVRDVAWRTERRSDSRLTPDETAVINAYESAYLRAMQPFLTIHNSPSHPEYQRWKKLTSLYSMDLVFFDEVLRRFCAPDLREAYYRANGIWPPKDSGGSSNTAGPAARPSSTTPGTSTPRPEIRLRATYVCSGERVIIEQCQVDDKSRPTTCTVNYPDRPRPRVIIEGESLNALLKLLHTCKQPVAAPSTTPVKSLTDRAIREATRDQMSAYDRFLKQGRSYLDSKQYEESVIAYTKAIDTLPNVTFAHNGLGMAYDGLGKFREAATEFREAVRLEPDDPTAYLNLGMAYGHLKEHSNAAKTFEQYVRLKPTDARVHSLLATTYKTLKEYDKAVVAFKEAIRLKPTDSSSWAGLGFSYYYLKRDAEALSALKEAIRLDPRNAYAYRGLGYLYVEQGRKDDAINVYRALLTLDKKEADRIYEEIKKLGSTP